MSKKPYPEIKSELKCAKCHQNAETEPNRQEYTKNYPIRSKDGTIHCWYCYKSISHCKVCNKSVAKMKKSAYDGESFPKISGYSRNCERVENEVEFICSQKCLDKLNNDEYQEWKEKLNQGWKKCEGCLDTVNWMVDISGNRESHKFVKTEKFQSRLTELVPPGEAKLCERHERKEKIEKPRKAEIRAEAQKYWDTLPYETRLREVKRTGSVGWGNFYDSSLNAEQIAAQGEVPYGVVYEFELKDCHQDCKDCHLNKDFQKPTAGDNNLSVSENSSDLTTKITVKEKLLSELKAENESSTEISQLEQEIRELKQQQQQNYSIPKPSKITPWIVGGVIIFVLGVFVVWLKKKHSSKNQATKYKY